MPEHLGLYVSRAFNEGIAAFHAWQSVGVSHPDADTLHTNPYPETKLKARWDWFKGWQAALYAPRGR